MVALLGVILRRPVVRQLGSEQLRGEVLSWGSGLRTVSELVVDQACVRRTMSSVSSICSCSISSCEREHERRVRRGGSGGAYQGGRGLHLSSKEYMSVGFGRGESLPGQMVENYNYLWRFYPFL